MKQSIAILFLGIYLLSSIGAQQLLKIPVAFQHFREHQREDSKISVLHFISIHYLHGSPKDKDYARDMQLPFKTSEDCISSIAIVFVSLIVPFSITKPVEIAEKKDYIVHDQFICSSYLSNIWQPPKYA